jgi:hypothetical protein
MFLRKNSFYSFFIYFWYIFDLTSVYFLLYSVLFLLFPIYFLFFPSGSINVVQNLCFQGHYLFQPVRSNNYLINDIIFGQQQEGFTIRIIPAEARYYSGIGWRIFCYGQRLGQGDQARLDEERTIYLETASFAEFVLIDIPANRENI